VEGVFVEGVCADGVCADGASEAEVCADGVCVVGGLGARPKARGCRVSVAGEHWLALASKTALPPVTISYHGENARTWVRFLAGITRFSGQVENSCRGAARAS